MSCGVRCERRARAYLDRHVLHVETDIVTGQARFQTLVMHLDTLDFSGDTAGGKVDDHAWLDDSSLDSADWHCSDTSNLVDILQGQTQGLVGRSAWGLDGVDGLEQGLSAAGAGLGLLGPSLVPRHVDRGLNHVVSVPSRDWDKGDSLGVVSDLQEGVKGRGVARAYLFDKARHFLDDFGETRLGPLCGVHLVDSDDELTYTEGVGQESVLTGLAILGDTSLKLTGTTSNDENGAISLEVRSAAGGTNLGGTSDHVLDEITMARGINDGDVVLWRLKLPQSDINGDTTLALSLEFVQNPGVLEGSLAHVGSLLLELFDGSLVDTSALEGSKRAADGWHTL